MREGRLEARPPAGRVPDRVEARQHAASLCLGRNRCERLTIQPFHHEGTCEVEGSPYVRAARDRAPLA